MDTLNLTASKKNIKYFDWIIESIDSLGKVTIFFNQQMNTNFSKSFLNSTYIDIHIKPFKGKYDSS